MQFQIRTYILNIFRLLLLVFVFLLPAPAGYSQARFKPERGTTFLYTVKQGEETYEFDVMVKLMMPYRSFQFHTHHPKTMQGEYNIANPAVKGTDVLILELQDGINNISSGMPLWLSMRAFAELSDSGKTLLSINESALTLFKNTGKTKVKVKLKGVIKSLNCLKLTEADKFTGKLIKGRELVVVNDPANPLVVSFKGKLNLKLKEISGK